VVEAEVVEARECDPRFSGCKSHRPPQSSCGSRSRKRAVA